jgi:putative transposase
MPRPKQNTVALTDEQRETLRSIIRKGEHSARVSSRAHALLLASEDKRDKDVAEMLHLTRNTVTQLRKRFVEAGLDAALYDKPRPGGKPKLDGKQEALLVALTCSKPESRETWTMQLLADRLVELGVVDEISDETVRRILKKTRSSPGKSSNGASAR